MTERYDYSSWRDFDSEAEEIGPGNPNLKPLITDEQIKEIEERSRRQTQELMALMKSLRRGEISEAEYRVAYLEMMKRHKAESEA